MSEHLSKIQFQKYIDRQLTSAELISIIHHLEICEKCHEEFDQMFPQLSTTAAIFNRQILETIEPFHLDYDDHLQPYINETIGEIDREIIECHIRDCAFCLQQVRELRDFKQSLELKALKKEIAQKESETIWTKLVNWIYGNTRILAFASLLIIFSLLGLWLFSYFQNKPQPIEEVKNQTQINSNIQTPTPENQNVNVEQNTNKFSINSNQTNKNVAPISTPETKPEEPEMANLVLPKYLNDLQTKKDILRGDENKLAEKIEIISPNGNVIRQVSPTLNWANIKDVQDYEVSIYDDNLNQIKKETVKGNFWKVPLNLSKGKMYQWQVSAKNPSKNFLGQGKFFVISATNEAKINQAKDSLQRGKALAEAGLLSEAKGELQKYLKKKPGSKLAKNYLNQLQSVK